MKKNLRFLMVAALATMFSTSAMAQDEQDPVQEEQVQAEEVQQNDAGPAPRVSANGSYQFQRSWGIGLQYGMTFTDMANWNDYLLVPGHMNYFDVHFVADHELYVEVTPVEGFRISAFGGWQNLYITDTGFNYAYGGLEPAFSVRRSFFEFAVGAGVAYGYSWLDSDTYQMDGHGLLVRPFVEARFYLCDIFALYLRVAFSYYKEFGLEEPGVDTFPGKAAKGSGQKINVDKLQYAGPNVAVGFRFGDYASPVVVVPDTDEDGVLDDIDDCPDVAGSEEFFGCTNPDSDGDGICDPWVSEKNLGASFAHICKGVDKCPELAGGDDVNGCPNPDRDGDGICDPWVAEKGLSDSYASVCKGSDTCVEDAEDIDGFKDDDGCSDPDNDDDGICDPWVEEKGLQDKYVGLCKAKDACPDLKGYEQFNGCPAPDSDEDGYCDEWVYRTKLEAKFKCKGLDKCPFEKGTDENGCIPRRVVVTADKIEIKDKIFFATNKATIKKESDSLLEEIAQVLKDNKQIKKIEIQGHTDSSGKAAKNLKLSDDRAKSVRDRLVKLGVETERLTYKGYGSTQMLIPLEKGQKKETKEQAAANRRVEFLILEQDTVTKEIDNPALKNK